MHNTTRALRALTGLLTTTLVLTAAAQDQAAPAAKPVKVFVLIGQSNMVGFGRIAEEGKPGTLEALCQEGKYPHLLDASGRWAVRSDVWCVKTTVGQKQGWLAPGFGARDHFFGPELQFGHVVGELYEEPVLIIKASQGNRSLGWDILPPGSKRFEHDGRVYAGYKDTTPSWVEGEPKEPVNWYAGKQYDDDIRHIHQVLDVLAKFFDEHYAGSHEIRRSPVSCGGRDTRTRTRPTPRRYEQNLVHLIKTLREEFEAPRAPFTLATIAFGGEALSGHGLTVANAQLAVSGESGRYPEFADNVRAVDARGFWRGAAVSPNARQDYHYHHNAETFLEVGNALGQAMAELLTADVQRAGK